MKDYERVAIEHLVNHFDNGWDLALTKGGGGSEIPIVEQMIIIAFLRGLLSDEVRSVKD